MGVDEFHKFIEDSLLNKALLVNGRGKVAKGDSGLEGFAKVFYETNIDIRFEEGGAYFLQHRLKGLRQELVGCMGREILLGRRDLLIEVGGASEI